MLAPYTRQPRTWKELGLGTFGDIDTLLPEITKSSHQKNRTATSGAPRRIERPDNGLGTARDVGAIVLENVENGQLMADCRALLIAVADGDGDAAAIALEAMRRAARLDTVEHAVGVADVLMSATTIESFDKAEHRVKLCRARAEPH